MTSTGSVSSSARQQLTAACPDSATVARIRPLPAALISRLPKYLRALSSLSDRCVPTVSSEELAGLTGVGSAVVRKDTSTLGALGIRGVGYDVTSLADQISRALGVDQHWPVVIVGAGHLGQALTNYPGFSARRFAVAALFDSGPMVGSSVGAMTVQDVAQLESVVQAAGITIAVIATPATVAQSICDRLVRVGVRSILNFAPVVLSVPDDVEVRHVDLSSELQILAFHAQCRASEQVVLPVAEAAGVDPVGSLEIAG